MERRGVVTISDDRVRIALILAAVTSVSAAALAYAVASKSADGTVAGHPAPSVPPLLLRELPPRTALSINRQIPFSPESNPAASPFHLGGSEADHDRALECLTTAIYYEAAAEEEDGQRAVAQVVLNRVRHPAFASSICGVVYEGSTRATGCQFSFTCDGSLRRTPSATGWARSRAIADAALRGRVFKPVGYATHYHADYVVPYWATSLAKNAALGRHIFYRWPGSWGRPPAFVSDYSANEADPLWLRTAALARWQNSPTPSVPLPKAELTVQVDPRVELISIVQLLANDTLPDGFETDYEREVRKHFSGFRNHVAVQIYRQLSEDKRRLDFGSAAEILMYFSPPPQLALRHKIPADLVAAVGGRVKLAGLVVALRNFGKHSEFEQFFQSKRAFYGALASRDRSTLTTFLTQLQNYTGVPVGDGTIVLTSLLQHAPISGCVPATKTSDEWLVIAPTATLDLAARAGRQGAVGTELRNALARQFLMPLVRQPNLSQNVCTRQPRGYEATQAETEIIDAILSRLEALSPRQLTPKKRIDNPQNKRVAAVVRDLNIYEQNRVRFPTLRDFNHGAFKGSQ